MHEQRRPLIRNASDLLGPGFGPQAVQTFDWSSDEAAFNGFFWSAPGAINAPDATSYWAGVCLATSDGSGVQRVTMHEGGVWPAVTMVRRYTTPSTNRLYSQWSTEANLAPLFSQTTTNQNIVGGTFNPVGGLVATPTSFGPGDRWLVTVSLDVAHNAGSGTGDFVCGLSVGGSVVTGVMRADDTNGGHSQISRQWFISHPATGTFDVHPVAHSVVSGATYVLLANNCTMSVIRAT